MHSIIEFYKEGLKVNANAIMALMMMAMLNSVLAVIILGIIYILNFLFIVLTKMEIMIVVREH